MIKFDRFAYVWYYSGRPLYLCSAIVAMKKLQSLRRREDSFPVVAVDYVLVYAHQGSLLLGEMNSEAAAVAAAELSLSDDAR